MTNLHKVDMFMQTMRTMMKSQIMVLTAQAQVLMIKTSESVENRSTQTWTNSYLDLEVLILLKAKQILRNKQEACHQIVKTKYNKSYFSIIHPNVLKTRTYSGIQRWGC